jgi:hypothetical protein
VKWPRRYSFRPNTTRTNANTCVFYFLQSSKTGADATPAESNLSLKKKLLTLVSDSDDDNDEQAKAQNPATTATKKATPRKPTTLVKPRQSLPGSTKAKAKTTSGSASASAPVRRVLISGDKESEAKEPPPPKKAVVDGGSKPTPESASEAKPRLSKGRKTGDDGFETDVDLEEEKPNKSRLSKGKNLTRDEDEDFAVDVDDDDDDVED